ncbi:MAG: transposase [Deltaproteobacteria bacterium]|nr:transposase [Deltaproteobacteria bacterium]
MTRQDCLDALRRFLQRTISQALLAELETVIGAKKYERSPERRNYHNGTYKRLVKTTLGDIEIEIPRDRNGEYKPVLLGRRKRSAIR